MRNPLKKKFWIEVEPDHGVQRGMTPIVEMDGRIYFMSDGGLRIIPAPEKAGPGRWKRAMETLENIVWWVGGLTFMVIVAVALMLLSTMALIGKWVISIDLLTALFQ